MFHWVHWTGGTVLVIPLLASEQIFLCFSRRNAFVAAFLCQWLYVLWLFEYTDDLTCSVFVLFCVEQILSESESESDTNFWQDHRNKVARVISGWKCSIQLFQYTLQKWSQENVVRNKTTMTSTSSTSTPISFVIFPKMNYKFQNLDEICFSGKVQQVFILFDLRGYLKKLLKHIW